MNNSQAINKANAFHVDALRILREVPGVDVEPEPQRGADRGVDAIVRFAGTQAEVAIEFKSRANAAAAWQVVRYALDRPDLPVLLVANETTTEAREILREHGVAIVDGLGNAHIELPGLLLHLQGAKRRPRRDLPARLSGKAGVVAQALLLEPERSWQVTDLAEKSKVSPGLAHRVLARLDLERLTESEGAGPKRVRRLSSPPVLLDLWAEEDQPRQRRYAGFVLARSPKDLLSKIGEGLADQQLQYAVTGAGAASLVAPFVTAVPVVDVWTSEAADPDMVLRAVGGEAVDEGHNVVLLQTKQDTALAFREQVDGVWVANRFRMYADLLSDPRRGAEQAKYLRSEVIGF
jgi:hypothetical protein